MERRSFRRDGGAAQTEVADAHYGLGAAWYDLHELPNAQKELGAATDLDPNNAAAHRLMAHIYSEQSDAASADREMRLALNARPSAEIYFALGLIEGQMGNLPGAAAQFHHAIHLNPKLAAADSEFRETLRVKPRYAEAHYNLALTLQQQGKETESQAEFEKAFAISPELKNAPRPQ